MRCNSFVLGLFLVLCLDVTCPSPWREAVNENDNPSGLKANTAMDDIERANKKDHTDKNVKGAFEADIILTESDDEGVDTKDFSSKDTADVDVDSVVSKRKTIRSRRNLWVKKVVPVELEATAKDAWNNIIAAVGEIQKASCIRFRMRKKEDDHWIRFVKKSGEKQMDFAGAPYDFNSIMHYGNYAFSKNNKPTMLSIMNPFLQFGQISKLSDNDIKQLNNAYDCKSDKSRGWSSWGNWGPCDTKCSRERERFLLRRRPEKMSRSKQKR
ncbi:hypothetical protein OS493_017846 [Desmophyllum pertusum]|uniref:Peptidase M12A domain-containing protein n=1 Tax=Desmophyllum pertusum TaxID=174260 RepID=A0A9W9Z031_9CNID|nr:hypothetical protein OS493_017846 [Desmophyllum pertusum]